MSRPGRKTSVGLGLDINLLGGSWYLLTNYNCTYECTYDPIRALKGLISTAITGS